MNELLINAVGPLREWFFGLGDIGMVLWIVLKILAIAMPVRSSAVPMRPKGTSAPTRRFFSPSGRFSYLAKSASTPSQCSPSTTPGAMALTLIPCRMRFSPADWVRLMTAAFEAH